MQRTRCGRPKCEDGCEHECDHHARGEIRRENSEIGALPALAREVDRSITRDRTNRSANDRTAEVHREIKIEDVARRKEHAGRRTDSPPSRNRSISWRFGPKTRARRAFPARA